jgi:uncharacterized protein (TIGR02145 family)
MNKSILILGMLFLITSSYGRNNNDKDSVIDADGNVYHTITIGMQTWTIENLKTTTYNDGTLIPNVTDTDEWANLSTGAYCNYNNSADFITTYGRLYNWYAVNTGKLAPKGWHVPTNEEWKILIDYLSSNNYGYEGKENEIAKSLASTSEWETCDISGTIGSDLATNNKTGFNAFPGGFRKFDGSFENIRKYGYWWSSTGFDLALYQLLLYNTGNPLKLSYGKEGGLSVRCLKD